MDLENTFMKMEVYSMKENSTQINLLAMAKNIMRMDK